MLKKVILIIFSCIGFICLSSCTREIPEGDIKDFVDKISYNRAYEQVVSGSSQVVSVYSEQNQELGRVSINTQIDKNQKYYFAETTASGSYIEEYKFQNQKILCYQDTNSSIQSYKLIDGNKEEVTYSLEELDQFITSFFYTQLESGFHQGSVYYGDYVIANCARYYSCFSLNEEKTELTYEVNTSKKNSEGNEILTMHHFVVDAYGMILSLHTKSIVVEKNIVVDTTIQCEYNNPIEKKLEI